MTANDALTRERQILSNCLICQVDATPKLRAVELYYKMRQTVHAEWLAPEVILPRTDPLTTWLLYTMGDTSITIRETHGKQKKKKAWVSGME